MPKIGASWTRIEPGDIISFRYQSVVDKSKQAKTSTILVLNTRFQKKLKTGDIGYYLNGMKLERSNISVFSSRDEAYNLLSEIGEIDIVDLKNEIFKIQIDQKYIGTWGANEKLIVALNKTPQGKKAQYRTYNWEQCRKSAVFYEPIKLPKDRVRILAEQQGIK